MSRTILNTNVGQFSSKKEAVNYIITAGIGGTRQSVRSFDSVPVDEVISIINAAYPAHVMQPVTAQPVQPAAQPAAAQPDINAIVAAVIAAMGQQPAAAAQVQPIAQPVQPVHVQPAPIMQPAAPTMLNYFDKFEHSDIGMKFATIKNRLVVFKPVNSNGKHSGLIVSREGIDNYAIHKVYVDSDSGMLVAKASKTGSAMDILTTIVKGYKNGGANPYKLDNTTIEAMRNAMRN